MIDEQPDIKEILGCTTPVSEKLADKLGYVKAAIISRVFYHQRLGRGICCTSIKTLSDKLGIATGSVSENLKNLVEKGYIVEVGKHYNGNHYNSYRLSEMTFKLLGIERSLYERYLGDSDLTKNDDQSQNERSLDEPNVRETNDNVHQANDNVRETNGKEVFKEDLNNNTLPKGSGEKPQKPKSDRPPPIPSFKVFVDITKCYGVTTYWRKQMAEVVGEEPEKLKLWEDILIGWTGNGWNPRNVKGQLECFGRGEIPGKERTNGHNQDRNQQLFGTGEGLAQRPVFDPYTGETVYPDGRRVKLP